MSPASFREEDRLSVAERNNKIPVFILGLRGLEPSSHSRVYGNFSRDFPILLDILHPLPPPARAVHSSTVQVIRIRYEFVGTR